MFFLALFAKIASAGAIAQAATGAGIVLVAFTGAGAAGVLPDPLQHGFATVADTVGVQVSDPSDTPAVDGQPPATDPQGSATDDTETTVPPTTEPTPTEAPAADGLTPEQKQWEAGPTVGESFGDWVSIGARHGWADGSIISHWAHLKHVTWPGTDDAATPSAAATSAADDEQGDDSTGAGSTSHESTSHRAGGQDDSSNGHSGGSGNSGSGSGNGSDHGSGHGDD